MAPPPPLPSAPWLTAARIVTGPAASAAPSLPPPKDPLSLLARDEFGDDSDEPMSDADSDSDYASDIDELEEDALDGGGGTTSARKFACKPCSLSFATRHEKELHARDVAHQRFPCTVSGCAKSYSKREHLTRHVLSIHTVDGQEKPFRCELCHIGFAYSHGLSRHMNRSHLNANKPFKCAQCLLAFKKKSDLQAHSFVHTGVLPFECGECGERFAKRFQLGRHERRHAANRDGQSQVLFCEEADCGQMLFSAEEKAQHDCEVHRKPPVVAKGGLGIKQESGAAATSKKRKRGRNGAPVKLQDGVEATRRQLLKCEVCGHMLQRKQNLRAHLRTHFEAVDERKMLVCPVEGCESAFTRKSNLMAHYNAVHDAVRSQRFVCPYDGCEGKFGYKKVLLTHIESIHVNPTPTKRAKAPGRTAASAKTRVLGAVVGEESGEATADGSPDAPPTDSEQ